MTVVGSGVREQDDRRSLVARSLQWPGCTGLWEPPPPRHDIYPMCCPFSQCAGSEGAGVDGTDKVQQK